MKAFTKISKALTLSNNGVKIEIFKYKKDGTKRYFWTPEKDGKRLTSIMFSTLSECRNLTSNYLRSL